MSRSLIFAYGLIAYAVGLGGLTFFLLYIGSWSFLPLHVDSKPVTSQSTALLVNTALILLWTLQHSIMARERFKQAWTKIIPPAAERSTYVLISGILMIVICLFWQPLSGTIWKIENSVGYFFAISAYCFGWTLAVASTFLINHFELFGLSQVTRHLKQQSEPEPEFTNRYFYKVVRHPLQLGILIGIWVTPTMTTTHFMLASTFTASIFLGLHLEEKDLLSSFGTPYKDYRSKVPMILPIPR